MFRTLFIFALWIGCFGHHPTSGKSVAASTLKLDRRFIKTDNMKKKPLTQLIEELNSIWHGKYCYDLVNDENYRNSKSKIPVICVEHNHVFEIAVGNHLYQKQECPIIANTNRRISNTGNVRKRPKLVYGIGINDYEKNIKLSRVHLMSYHTWEQMLKRCYSEELHKRQKTYANCSVCDEWLLFSNFKKWFDENYIKGYHLDKDILIKGNKLYSPNTCCFVPPEINVLLCKNDAKRGDLPVGVSSRIMINGIKYVAGFNKYGKRFHLGTFSNKHDAFNAYKKAKEFHIKEMAKKYFKEGKIKENVYNALMSYKVDITD